MDEQRYANRARENLTIENMNSDWSLETRCQADGLALDSVSTRGHSGQCEDPTSTAFSNVNYPFGRALSFTLPSFNSTSYSTASQLYLERISFVFLSTNFLNESKVAGPLVSLECSRAVVSASKRLRTV